MNERADAVERLVDGELSAEEYRHLLAALDDETGGWRRCALAFLEAQALAADMRGLAPPSHGAGVSMVRAKPIGTQVSNMAMLLAMAASFLVVFGLGIAAPSLLRVATQEMSGSGNSLAQQPGPNMVADSAVPGAVRSRPLNEPRYVGDVQLVFDGSTKLSSEAGRVPIYDVGRDVNAYLADESPALAPEMVDLVRQLGFDVRHHQQQYLPAPLEDGRQIIVPVDGYQITPVSRRY